MPVSVTIIMKWFLNYSSTVKRSSLILDEVIMWQAQYAVSYILYDFYHYYFFFFTLFLLSDISFVVLDDDDDYY